MRKVITFVIIIVVAFGIFPMKTECVAAGSYISEEYQSYCEEIGELYGICPELLIAMIEAESSGNPNAKNGTCKGLLQISEEWHRDRMKRLGVTDIYEPRGNILVAADYLLELFERYEDVAMVLMKYNGDSRARAYWNGEAEMSEYAKKILARSEYLERVNGK